MRRRADFRRLVQRLRDECAQQGFEPSAGLIEDLLAHRIQAMADLLRVQVATVLGSYATSINVSELAAEIVRADRLRRQEVADTPHVILDLGSVGRLVSSLGQAVRCVSLNHDTIGQGKAATWAAVGVLDDASNALTLLGASLQDSHRSGSLSVVLSDETVVYARPGRDRQESAREAMVVRPRVGRHRRPGGRPHGQRPSAPACGVSTDERCPSCWMHERGDRYPDLRGVRR